MQGYHTVKRLNYHDSTAVLIQDSDHVYKDQSHSVLLSGGHETLRLQSTLLQKSSHSVEARHYDHDAIERILIDCSC